MITIEDKKYLKYTIWINWGYIAILLVLGGFSLTVLIYQLINYQILNSPIDPLNSPLINLGVIVFFLYTLPAAAVIIINIWVKQLKNKGRWLNIMILPLGIWLLFPFSIPLVIFQAYTLTRHRFTVNKFKLKGDKTYHAVGI